MSRVVFLLLTVLVLISPLHCSPQGVDVEDNTEDVMVRVNETAASDMDEEIIDLDNEAKDLDIAFAVDDVAEAAELASASDSPTQSGPFIDLLGPTLYSLEMVDETRAKLTPQLTNDVLSGKNVVGLYFSADWCGPCRKFTPELVQFYDKMNKRRGAENKFEIVWVSRCRDMDSYGQYFTHMKWLALPPEEAMGQRGQMLSNKYKVKGIPSLVLLDEVGNVITTDARNRIPQDKAGIGFPWRNPLATLYTAIFPKALRLMVKSQVVGLKDKAFSKIKSLMPIPVRTPK